MKLTGRKRPFGRTGSLPRTVFRWVAVSKDLLTTSAIPNNNEKAIVLNSDYKRHLLSFKGDYKITRKLAVGASVRIPHRMYWCRVSDDKGSAYNRLRNAVKYRPFLSSGQDIDESDPFADPNVGNGLNLTNPILFTDAEYRRKTNTFNITANASYVILKT